MQQFSLENSGEQQEIYRAKMAELLRSARNYDGTEENYVRTMRELIGFEQWLAEVFGDGEKEGKAKRLSDQMEKELAKTMEVKSERTIADIMDLMSKRASRVIFNRSANVDGKPRLEELKIVTVELDGVLLPPGEFRIEGVKGQKVEEKEIRFEQRLEKLLALLNQKGIFLDDLIICSGKLNVNQIRQEGYYLVEIPRINKEVMVCQQVGEATFVIDGIFSRDTFMRMSKEELQEKYQDQVTRVVFRDEKQWEKELLATLLSQEVGQKIDVKSQEALRKAVLEQFHMAKDWAGLSAKQKNNLKIGRLGLIALATKFGVKGDPNNYHKVHLELGRKIYGENQPALQVEEVPELSLEELKNTILERFPSAEIWASLSQKQRKTIKIAGMGLAALARKFGREGDPIGYRKFHLELGREIYGNDQVVLQFEEILELSLEELRAEILKRFPTAEIWAGLSVKDKSAIKISGLGLKALATKFEVKGDPDAYRKFYLELGRKIYGEDHPILQEMSLEELKMMILEQFPTAEDWAGLSVKQKSILKIGRLGLVALARKFGVNGHAIDHRKIFLALGREIYGNDKVVLQFEEVPELSLEELRAEILKRFPTAEIWAGLSVKQKSTLKIGRLGLVALATKFGVKGNPISYLKFYLELGRKIYGENEVFQSKKMGDFKD